MIRKISILLLSLLLLIFETVSSPHVLSNIPTLSKAYAQDACNGSDCVTCTGTTTDTNAAGTVVLYPLYSSDPQSIPLANGTFTFSAIPANSDIAQGNPSVIDQIQIQASGYNAKDIELNGDDPCSNLSGITLTKTDGSDGSATKYTLTESNACIPADNGEFDSEAQCMETLCDRVSNFPDEYSEEIQTTCNSFGIPQVSPSPTPPLQLCQTSSDTPENCDTALGLINTNPGQFISSVLGILLSISGMIALYLIIRSGYQLMTSRGNPEAVQDAKERLTSAIVGLLFVIFALVVAQVVGADILRIPGFGK